MTKLKLWIIQYIIYPIYSSPFTPLRMRRVRCLVFKGDKLLLVRHSTGNRQLSLPGGGVKLFEQYVDCAHRELKEELGITRIRGAQYAGTIVNQHGLNSKHYKIITAKIANNIKLLPNFEIEEYVFLKPENIDWGDTDKLVKQALSLL